MIELYLMRHGEAAPVGGAIARDKDRPLTLRGRRQVMAVAVELQRRSPSLGYVVSSPYRRALETAEIVAEILEVAELRPSTLLAPRGAPPPLPELIRQTPPAAGLLLVGHQPDLGMLSAALCGHDVRFSPGMLSAFRWDSDGAPGKGCWLWSLDPEEFMAR